MSLRKKHIQAIIVLIVALIIALTGTFAWFSFNQRVTNEFEIKTPPNVNLHDDFEGGPEKDVYVENSGQRDVFVRVRLSEFMQIGAHSLVPGAVKDDPNTWTVHVPNASGACQTCIDNPNLEWFHTYYEWTMGGRKFYRPAQVSAQGYGDPLDPTGAIEPYKEPDVVGDVTDYEALLRNAFQGDNATLALIDKFVDFTQVFTDADYTALQTAIEKLSEDPTKDIVIWTQPTPEDYDGTDPFEPEIMTLSQIRLTQSGDPVGLIGTQGNEVAPKMVITMAEWIAGSAGYEPYAKGDFWVIDTDGWAYWANPLKPGEATGLLLTYVERTEKFPADDAYYAIDVWLQAVTADDLERFDMAANQDGGGGITQNGYLLMSLGTGDFVYDADSDKFYYDYGNNVYAEIDTSTKENILNKVTTGGKFIGGPNGELGTDTIVAGNQIYIAEVVEGELEAAKSLTLGAELTIVTGRNGLSYIDLGDGSYAVTVEYDSNTGKPVEPYTIIDLGIGYEGETTPFIRVWPGTADGAIGTANDVYDDPYVELQDSAVMHYLGDGVYVATTGPDALGRYTDVPGTYYLTDLSREDVKSLSDVSAFEIKLEQGDLFRFEPASEGGPGFSFDNLNDDGSEDFVFEFAGMVRSEVTGKWYIATADETKGGHENPQGENTYIGLNPEGTDGGKFGSENNVLVWASTPGRDDQYDPMSEPFLKGVKKEALLPGGDGFEVDGANWRVLDIDEFGNRLLLCDSLAGNKVTMGKSLYSQSNVRAEMQKIMATLPTINKYALPVETPVWYRQLTSAGGLSSKIATGDYTLPYNYNDAELSKPKNVGGDWSTAGAEAFALSLSEAIKYSDGINDCNDSWWLRSAGKITGCGTKLYENNLGGGKYYQKSEPQASQICGTHDGLSFVRDYGENNRDIHTMGAYTDSFRCRAAMWVRFSDADKVAKQMGGLSWDDYQDSLNN